MSRRRSFSRAAVSAPSNMPAHRFRHLPEVRPPVRPTFPLLTVTRPPMRITDVRVTPIAFRDPPLLNVSGVHEPWALRSIIEVEAGDGHVGLGESYGDLE